MSAPTAKVLRGLHVGNTDPNRHPLSTSAAEVRPTLEQVEHGSSAGGLGSAEEDGEDTDYDEEYSDESSGSGSITTTSGSDKEREEPIHNIPTTKKKVRHAEVDSTQQYRRHHSGDGDLSSQKKRRVSVTKNNHKKRRDSSSALVVRAPSGGLRNCTRHQPYNLPPQRTDEEMRRVAEAMQMRREPWTVPLGGNRAGSGATGFFSAPKRMEEGYYLSSLERQRDGDILKERDAARVNYLIGRPAWTMMKDAADDEGKGIFVDTTGRVQRLKKARNSSFFSEPVHVGDYLSAEEKARASELRAPPEYDPQNVRWTIHPSCFLRRRTTPILTEKHYCKKHNLPLTTIPTGDGVDDKDIAKTKKKKNKKMKKKSKSSSGNNKGDSGESHHQRPVSARTTRTVVIPKPEWKAVRTVDHSHTDWVDYYSSSVTSPEGGGGAGEVLHNRHHHLAASLSAPHRRPMTANNRQHRIPQYEDGSVVSRLHTAPRPPSAVSGGRRPTSSSSVRTVQGRTQQHSQPPPAVYSSPSSSMQPHIRAPRPPSAPPRPPPHTMIVVSGGAEGEGAMVSPRSIQARRPQTAKLHDIHKNQEFSSPSAPPPGTLSSLSGVLWRRQLQQYLLSTAPPSPPPQRTSDNLGRRVANSDSNVVGGGGGVIHASSFSSTASSSHHQSLHNQANDPKTCSHPPSRTTTTSDADHRHAVDVGSIGSSDEDEEVEYVYQDFLYDKGEEHQTSQQNDAVS